MAKKIDKVPNKRQEPETTGHEWDGIKEYNNPLPRWWLWTFIACIIFSVGYIMYYPWLPDTPAGSGWTQHKQLRESQAIAKEAQKVFADKVSMMSPRQILRDDSVRGFAIEGGKAAFALHCSQCHGSGANGAKGFPSLLDDEWLWGGRLRDIMRTIKHGINSAEDENTRMSEMMAFGDDELLEASEIKDVVQHIMVKSKQIKPTDGSENGAMIFAENCASCHGMNGEGIQEMGAPNLYNAIWLHGGDKESLTQTITHGRKGEMPAFATKLDHDTVKKLAVYVYSLSGGER
jgi:cytochrome c oxidase cbb3-type subunit 3